MPRSIAASTAKLCEDRDAQLYMYATARNWA